MNEIFVENAQHYYDLRKKTEVNRTNVKTVCNRTETLTFFENWNLGNCARLH